MAEYNLGAMYRHGQGVDVNQEGDRVVREGNEAGHAGLSRSVRYGTSWLWRMNYKKAIEWYEKAAEQGLAGAQFNLGIMYENGAGVDQSDSMAMRWYACRRCSV